MQSAECRVQSAVSYRDEFALCNSNRDEEDCEKIQVRCETERYMRVHRNGPLSGDGPNWLEYITITDFLLQKIKIFIIFIFLKQFFGIEMKIRFKSINHK